MFCINVVRNGRRKGNSIIKLLKTSRLKFFLHIISLETLNVFNELLRFNREKIRQEFISLARIKICELWRLYRAHRETNRVLTKCQLGMINKEQARLETNLMRIFI